MQGPASSELLFLFLFRHAHQPHPRGFINHASSKVVPLMNVVAALDAANLRGACDGLGGDDSAHGVR